MDQQQYIDFVLRTVEERDIRFIRLWFTDVLGRLKSFAISPEDLEVAFEEGIGFDGSAIEGFTTPDEADMLAFPDPSTFQILPWRPTRDGAARIFCDACTPDRQRFAGDSRECLRRMFYRAEKLGYIMNVGAELEFYYFPDERTPEPLDAVGYFDLSPSDSARDLRRSTVLMLEKMSIPIEYTFHSSGHSQHGISMRHAEALTMSDAIMTAKHVISTCLRGRHPCQFHAKPIARARPRRCFAPVAIRPRGQQRVLGRRFAKPPVVDRQSYMASILAHASEISAITNPTVNSYAPVRRCGNGPRLPRGACATALP
ncbi:MAG: glutamine synthetase beta-grasp domain-containing protein [Collinsella intestinalis]